MGFKCGIIGLPNVGKSTLFNALTNAGIGAENYPFCTIQPNVGIVPVPDPRLQQIAEIARPAQIIPAQMEFVDIAGLVAGASTGAGLGNKFLSHIREVHALAQVVRCFEDENIVHVAGRIDPLSDIALINTELCLADQDTLERAAQRLQKSARAGNKHIRQQLAWLEKALAHVDAGQPLRSMRQVAEAGSLSSELNLLTALPGLYIANVEEADIGANKHLAALARLAAQEGAQLLPICAALEAEIAGLESREQEEFLSELGLAEPGLDRIIRAGYELLGRHTYFTAGPKEVRAWTLRVGATAVEAAATIHTDFARGFIRAEVIAFADYIEHKGEQGAKEAGKWRLEGKDYIVQDGDLMLFRFNV